MHEDEIADILAIRFDQWNETTAIMEAYEQQFYNDLEAAWNQYVEDTRETVQAEAALHRQTVEHVVDYLWDNSAFPGTSLDDVYPRPSVSFAARDTSTTQASNNKADVSGYFAGAAVATLAFSGLAAYSYSKA